MPRRKALNARHWFLVVACFNSLGASCLLSLAPAFQHNSPYQVSAPEALPPGIVGQVEKSGHTVLRLDALKLGLLALDAIPTPPLPNPGLTSISPSLMIRFEFEPAILGYSFNPMLVSLRTAEGKILHPVAYVGPGKLLWHQYGRSCHQPGPGRFRASVELPARLESLFIPLPSGSACFVVSFDTRVGLGTVVLSIEGINRGAEPVAIPAFALSRRTVGDSRPRSDETRPDTNRKASEGAAGPRGSRDQFPQLPRSSGHVKSREQRVLAAPAASSPG